MTLHARINHLQSRIDATARAADLADFEALRHYPGQDVPAARRHARQLRRKLIPLHTELHRLQARLPQEHTTDLEALHRLADAVTHDTRELRQLTY